jgi:hypothetical protein
MEIRARMWLVADGFVGRPEDGMPSQLVMPDWNPQARSHGHLEFIEGCDAAVMGRTTFLPARGAPSWPWPGLQVYVLISSPLPAGPDWTGRPGLARTGPDWTGLDRTDPD